MDASTRDLLERSAAVVERAETALAEAMAARDTAIRSARAEGYSLRAIGDAIGRNFMTVRKVLGEGSSGRNH